MTLSPILGHSMKYLMSQYPTHGKINIYSERSRERERDRQREREREREIPHRQLQGDSCPSQLSKQRFYVP